MYQRVLGHLRSVRKEPRVTQDGDKTRNQQDSLSVGTGPAAFGRCGVVRSD